MSTTDQLPGLERLLAVCREHGIGFEVLPAGRTAPGAGSMFMGRPFDALLAAAFARVGRLMLSPHHSLLIQCDDEVNALVSENGDSRKYWPERFHSLVVFGKEMRYCYATVPEIASSEGFQPVVWIDPYEEVYALPVASDVNRFFETYSRYLEVVAEEPDFKERQVPSLSFPWDVPDVLAADGPLVEMIRAGKFDPWMYCGKADLVGEIRRWATRIQSGGPAGRG